MLITALGEAAFAELTVIAQGLQQRLFARLDWLA